MAERKVLNKYIPPDFDPSQLKRVKAKDRTGPKLQTVRLMTPFSMRCNACGEYIYKGKKFNARKEDTLEKYYSVKIYRFHIKCTRCSGSITFRTDPKNADYAAESGAQRNFEPWRTEPAAQDDDETELDKLEEEEENVMAALESKTMDAKQEMEIADALDEIRTRNAMNARADPDKLLKKMERDRLAEEEARLAAEAERTGTLEEDILAARAVFQGDQGAIVRRIRDDADAADVVNPPGDGGAVLSGSPTIAKPVAKFMPQVVSKRPRGSLLGVKVVRKTKLV
ncbi:Cell cycle control protein cwf16 [Taphrina deformans PYCC 5710]|uniref:Splicing factor YJU2 n=1 Tax=Taphrina deformans (strain PYCC 5710 / ATCC 11124 / CBS 356.35 / IMI 108563 / JCM 9778 / NBRC 8474) TaxID=1097556 RepID=R4XIN2_TAPDE|nr:Cell cycle control protein cwf16 [Taphrina deformans PYCC 5710]|eukprot:CCG83228.1 Cell cycle control protein cwf16 [Taphrina deformans PYCC 5710]